MDVYREYFQDYNNASRRFKGLVQKHDILNPSLIAHECLDGNPVWCVEYFME